VSLGDTRDFFSIEEKGLSEGFRQCFGNLVAFECEGGNIIAKVFSGFVEELPLDFDHIEDFLGYGLFVFSKKCFCNVQLVKKLGRPRHKLDFIGFLMEISGQFFFEQFHQVLVLRNIAYGCGIGSYFSGNASFQDLRASFTYAMKSRGSGALSDRERASVYSGRICGVAVEIR